MVHLNLSRRPFLNTRPVTRVALLLWALGALLLLGNVTLFWNYLSGSTEKREELARMEEQVEKERDSVGRLEARLAGLDLEQQNEQVEFLNRKIAERTFSWSLLFERLTETMPDNVRLIQLQPAAIGDERAQTRSRTRTAADRNAPLASDRVPLVIAAEAKSDEELLRFVDNLFAHPSFDNPNLLEESRNDQGDRVQFSLHVTYLPRDATPGVTVEEEPEIEEETPAATPPAATPSAEDSETE
jgi:Tfp pilus assembly protein PilN